MYINSISFIVWIIFVLIIFIYKSTTCFSNKEIMAELIKVKIVILMLKLIL